MVNPAIKGYMEVQKLRQKVDLAVARVDAAYLLHQQALEKLGPFPTHGWDRARLAGREDALLGAVENYKAVVGEVLAALSLLELRPPF